MESDLASLIARLETAKEGSRELDRSVWAWVAEHVWKWPEGQTGADADGKNNSVVLIPTDLPKDFTYPPKGAVDRYYHVPSDPITTDLSAAVTLCERVLPGRYWATTGQWTVERGPHHYTAQIDANRFPIIIENASTAAIALCIAILRALDTTHN